ncbi:TIGR03086 family protein [Pseudonocardiaceae bacterium YIM PH 21723]|nr:TIGR03086 family protein [Pseudonocardiaceae bacterium YIM PH 21723]
MAGRCGFVNLVERVWRQESAHVLAALLRRHGDLADCEDAAQEAVEAAVTQWPVRPPDDPRAWLVRVASRRLIDTIRSTRARVAREEKAEDGPAVVSEVDDSLAMLVLCCHPSLSRGAQIALTLRSVAGLSTERIAAAHLVPEPTMSQRLRRARATLREAGARFELPSLAELPSRIAVVLDVCHLMATEGHLRTGGRQLMDTDLAGEALRLVGMLHRALPDHDEVSGLLALLLFTTARTAARIDEDGDLVPLEAQDRGRWDRVRIAEGVALLERVLPRGPVGRFQLQAAIAAVHAEAPSAADTDWAQISELYAMLHRVAPGPAVTLNRAVAVAMHTGPEAGLSLLDPLLELPATRRHHRTHAVRAHLLEMSGDLMGAAAAYRLAGRLTTSRPEQRYLNHRLTALHPLDMTPAARTLGAIVAGVREHQLGLTTPSSAYRVADLLEHVDGLARGLRLAAHKLEVPADEFRDGDGRLLEPGWRERIPAALLDLAGAWAQKSAWQGDTVQGGVALPAADSGMFVLDELIVHGWELARATGQSFDPDPGAVEAVLQFLLRTPRNADMDQLFGPVVAVPDTASPLDRLLGLTGRDPGWARS